MNNILKLITIIIIIITLIIMLFVAIILLRHNYHNDIIYSYDLIISSDKYITLADFDRSEHELLLTISDEWISLPYTKRIDLLKTYWKQWSGRKPLLDYSIRKIEIQDKRHNIVGGSNSIAGYLIWVQCDAQ